MIEVVITGEECGSVAVLKVRCCPWDVMWSTGMELEDVQDVFVEGHSF